MQDFVSSSVDDDFSGTGDFYMPGPEIIDVPDLQASVAITLSKVEDSSSVMREDGTIPEMVISDSLSVIPWGASNRMPFEIIRKIEQDETMSTCMQFNAEAFYAAGLTLDTDEARPDIVAEVEDFMMRNDMVSYWLGSAHDLRHFAFAVSVIILNQDGTRVVSLRRKEACYCRFTRQFDRVAYANWRLSPAREEDIEVIPLLDRDDPWDDLIFRAANSPQRKFAFLTRVPTVDATYYPIPYYGSLFLSKWYDIKRLIAVAKEAKLRNSAPIKYHIEVARGYWLRKFQSVGITDPLEQKAFVEREKSRMIDFLTGAANSGKVWFSTFYKTPDGHEEHDVLITKVESSKEGGDWETDIQEAINMVCFTLRVHSNLVGSVPGKSQSNNSGSDKRELYTISQALQKPYRDLMFRLLRVIIRFNRWTDVRPLCPLIQLTTLDEHRDSKESLID